MPVESRLLIERKKWRSWLCRIPLMEHAFRTLRSSGWRGEVGYYAMEECSVCGQRDHVFLEETALADEEMRARSEKEQRGFAAMAWLLDNVEPDYAAGRGTENGRVVDRDEPWEVPLKARRPSGEDADGT